MHKHGYDKNWLKSIMAGISDTNKKNLYPSLITTYSTFLGRKKIEWFEPENTSWQTAGLTVRVNPELGLIIKDDKYLVKLYFKSDNLSKNRLASISQIMNLNLGINAENAKLAIMDVRNSKLYELDQQSDDLQILLEGEAAALVSMYNKIKLP